MTEYEIIEMYEKEIRRHDDLYWNKNKPVISDPDYDKLVNKLLILDPNNNYLNKPKTPLIESNGKVVHKIKMLSLDKAYSFKEVLKWCKKVARTPSEGFKLMPKLDGVSGQLMDGILATRGDGEEGENITHKLPFMDIVTKGDIDNVRGEILFTKSQFKKIKGMITRKSGEEYKNERNAVGGVLSRDDLEPIKILSFVDFEFSCTDYTLTGLEQLAEYDELGWNSICLIAQELDYPIDGMVIKVADEEYAESLGATRHHLKSAIAFKFTNPFKWSKVTGVTWSMGKHVLTPIIQIEPIKLSGVTITNVSGHNMKNIVDNDICIGDIIKVERAGDVIPYATDFKAGETRVGCHITNCPVCDSPLRYSEPEIACINDDCPGKLLNKLSDAVIRIGIDRLGKPTIKKMMDTFQIENLVDIFNLERNDIITMEGFGRTSTDNLYAEIQSVKDEGVYEWQLLAALNIPGIGRSLSKDLLADRSLLNLSELSILELIEIEGIGPERAKFIHEGIYNNSKYLHDLGDILPIKVEEVKDNNVELIKVCFTGRFPEKKSHYYDLLKENGGYEIMEKVNKETQVLIVADTSKESNKMKAAKKKGIQIMGIEELLKGL